MQFLGVINDTAHTIVRIQAPKEPHSMGSQNSFSAFLASALILMLATDYFLGVTLDDSDLSNLTSA